MTQINLIYRILLRKLAIHKINIYKNFCIKKYTIETNLKIIGREKNMFNFME
jgi:hypothetical protein